MDWFNIMQPAIRHFESTTLIVVHRFIRTISIPVASINNYIVSLSNLILLIHIIK
jgi:hypothetical protein